MVDLDGVLPDIAAGDPEVFGRWLAGAEPALRASLRRFAAVVDTEGVLQETLLRVWQIAPRHVPDGKPQSVLRLAVRIARNLAVDEVRRTRAEVVDPGTVDAPADDPPPDPLLRRVIRECYDLLRGKPAEALAAR